MGPTEQSGARVARAGAVSGEHAAIQEDALIALEDAVWARAGQGDTLLHQRLQQALHQVRAKRRSEGPPEQPGAFARMLRNPLAVLTPLLALIGVGWQQLSAASELAHEQAQAKREVRLSLIQAYLEADNTDQRLSVLETSRVMPSVMGECSGDEGTWTLVGLLGYQARDCEARARAAEWVTKQTALLADLQEREAELRATLEDDDPDAASDTAHADADADDRAHAGPEATPDPEARPEPQARPEPIRSPERPKAEKRSARKPAPSEPSKVDRELYKQRMRRIYLDEF